MKANNKNTSEKGKKKPGIILQGFALFLLIQSTLISCVVHHDYMGEDGRPGLSYLALTWDIQQPDYLDAGTADIPPRFSWGTYYLTDPGFYTLYYDGIIRDQYGWHTYAWEVDYEIYNILGEQGSINHHGHDGPDTYLSIECNPYGPYMYSDYKSLKSDQGFELLSMSANEITIDKKGKGHGVKITYRSTEKR